MGTKPVYPGFDQDWAKDAVFHVHINKVDVWTVQWSRKRKDKGHIVLLKFGEPEHMYRVVPYPELQRMATVFPEYYDPVIAYLEMVGVFDEK